MASGSMEQKAYKWKKNKSRKERRGATAVPKNERRDSENDVRL